MTNRFMTNQSSFNLLTQKIKIGLNSLIWVGALSCCNTVKTLQAQVIEDDTLPTEVDTTNNLDFEIEAGEQTGANLFHSFQEFSIPDNGSVIFNNAATVQNIFSRVTGTSISNINGLIQSNGSANLFLLNPNGIIFGENATLNIGGSFFGTTAESVVFEDGSQFGTDLNTSEPLLAVNVPLGLQFGSNPGEIINRANFSIPDPADQTGQGQLKLGLSVIPGKTMTLLGGDITFDGGAIAAPAGNIEVGSVAESSFVGLDPIARGWSLNYDSVDQFRNLVLDNLASIDGTGSSGGSINVQGRQISVLNGSVIASDTFGAVDGGDVTLKATELVEINGSDPTNQTLDLSFSAFGIFVPVSSRVTTNTFGTGNSGNIKIQSDKLSILNGAKIQTRTIASTFDNSEQPSGNNGNIAIATKSLVELRGSKPLLGIADNAQELFQSIFPVPSEAQSFLGLNRAIGASQVSKIDSISFSTGNTGNINIITSQLKVKEGSSISNSPTPFSGGSSGDIEINSRDLIEISGLSQSNSDSVSIISANTLGQGNAGNIFLTTAKLSLSDGGGITSGTLGAGSGGDIVLDAGEINISGTADNKLLRSGFGSETFSVGDAGNLTVNTNRLTIADQGQITVRGLSSGTPGNLNINANVVELDNGRITAENISAAQGGNINLQIEENLTLKKNSIISAQAFNQVNGGNVDIQAQFVIAFPQQNSDILANALAGNGGNINIVARGVFGLQAGESQPANLTNDIDASSEFGAEGRLRLDFPRFSSAEGLFNLPDDFTDVNYLFRNSFCKISQESRYTVTGRGGIPLIPEDDFAPAHTWTDWRILEGDRENIETTKGQNQQNLAKVEKITLIQGWVRDRQGRIVLTADSSVATPSRSPINSPSCNRTNLAN